MPTSTSSSQQTVSGFFFLPSFRPTRVRFVALAQPATTMAKENPRVGHIVFCAFFLLCLPVGSSINGALMRWNFNFIILSCLRFVAHNFLPSIVCCQFSSLWNQWRHLRRPPVIKTMLDCLHIVSSDLRIPPPPHGAQRPRFSSFSRGRYYFQHHSWLAPMAKEKKNRSFDTDKSIRSETSEMHSRVLEKFQFCCHPTHTYTQSLCSIYQHKSMTNAQIP